jgi:ubiquitin-protein ligase E3 C
LTFSPLTVIYYYLPYSVVRGHVPIHIQYNREIDYSGTANRSKGRRDILKNAEAQRKQRQENLRRDKAARLIQRVTRGYFSRVHTIERLLVSDTSTPSTNMRALWMCLSYQSYLQKFDVTRMMLLLQYQQEHQSNKNCLTSDSDDSSNVLRRPMEMDVNESTAWYSQRQLLKHVLAELYPTDSNDRNEQQQQQQSSLFRLFELYWESTRLDDDLFLSLMTCMKGWCLMLPQNHITTTLTHWAVEASTRLPNPNAKALLAAILLSSGGSNGSIQFALQEDFMAWFTPLTNILKTSNISVASTASESRMLASGSFANSIGNGGAASKDILSDATLGNLKNDQVHRLLSNLLDVTKTPHLVLVIHHVLSQPEHRKLRIAVALLVRGDVLDGGDTTNAINNNTIALNDWDDESDGDAADAEQLQDPSSNYKKARGSAQYSRKELLTLAKLDHLYSERIHQGRQEYVVFDSDTQDIANKIVRAPWAEWGLYLLSQGDIEKRLYVDALAILLQSSSNLRPMTKLGVLSPVAFNKTLLQSLWALTQQSHLECFIAVFADLFSHYLVALSDKDFLKYHSPYQQSADNPLSQAILAKDLVAFYGSVLYDIYWAKPVVADEIRVDNVRGRMLLSGTKLWNSLYERWDRLVKDSFCEESSWWFPHLASQDGEKAVVPAREIDHTMNVDDNDDDSIDVDVSGQISSAEAETDALADSFRDPKMARLLTSIPQALPFDRRVKLFHSLLTADKHKTNQAAASRRSLMAMAGGDNEDDGMFFFGGSVREQVMIRRSALYQDSLEKLNALGGKLKNRVQVTFINQHGAEEAGIDGGGVFKEFLDDLIKDGFGSKNGDANDEGSPQLFTITPMQTLTVNLDVTEDKDMLVHYEFLGRVLGKAVYESILVEPQFCLPFLNQILGKANTLEDLKNYDEEYYTNLSKLRLFNETEIDGLGLTFELNVGGNAVSSTPRTVDLLRNGKAMPLTKRNVFQYTHLVAHQLLNVQGAQQTRAFLRGFRDLIPVSWVRLFSAKELQKLISGDDKPIDIAALKKVMHYLGGYHESQPYIEVFWEIIENELSEDQQRNFLRFMTSCSRQPLLGFSSLVPVPSIQQIRLRDDELSKNSRLPTSQTCMNLLKLPNYQDRDLLKQKLLAAVEAGAGFELT